MEQKQQTKFLGTQTAMTQSKNNDAVANSSKTTIQYEK